jgi:hypothetical protein
MTSPRPPSPPPPAAHQGADPAHLWAHPTLAAAALPCRRSSERGAAGRDGHCSWQQQRRQRQRRGVDPILGLRPARLRQRGQQQQQQQRQRRSARQHAAVARLGRRRRHGAAACGASVGLLLATRARRAALRPCLHLPPPPPPALPALHLLQAAGAAHLHAGRPEVRQLAGGQPAGRSSGTRCPASAAACLQRRPPAPSAADPLSPSCCLAGAASWCASCSASFSSG